MVLSGSRQESISRVLWEFKMIVSPGPEGLREQSWESHNLKDSMNVKSINFIKALLVI